jgi:hypothetical protein
MEVSAHVPKEISSNSPKECCICLDPVDESEKPVMYFECKHERDMHTTCAREYIQSGLKQGRLVTCPLCRQPLVNRKRLRNKYNIRDEGDEMSEWFRAMDRLMGIGTCVQDRLGGDSETAISMCLSIFYAAAIASYLGC